MSGNTEIIEKKVDIEQALSRMRRPLDLTTVNVEVYGVYSLPDQWKLKIQENDPNEQSYYYELEACGMTLRNSRVFPKELTEEEKADAAAAATAKGGKQPPAPAKDAKKGGGPEEPSKEELERQEKEKREREERERKLREEWDSLDEETRFFRTAEDIYKQPCVKFQNTGAQRRIEQLQAQLATTEAGSGEYKEMQEQINELQGKIYSGSVMSEKQGFELVEFEEWVQKDGGCWIRLMKLLPQEEAATDPKAAAAAKGAPAKGAPKGGAALPSDLKPFFGRAWLSFDQLLKPGAIETKQRIFVETCPPMIKKTMEDGSEKYVQSEEPYDNVFEQNRTYVSIKVTLSDPVTPTAALSPEPQPQDVVPIKQFVRWPFSKEPTDDFKKQISLAVESLAKEYYNQFESQLIEEQKDRVISETKKTEKFEERKKEFLYEINTSGKYHIMKEKMKKTIVRIVKEHFHKQEKEGIKGIYKDERDHFYSQLYAYLVQQMKETVRQIVQRKKNELHDNISVPKDQYIQEMDRIISSSLTEKETLAQRYARLAQENEDLYCNFQEAESLRTKMQALTDGDSESLLALGRFFLRSGQIEKADKYLRDAYSFQIKSQNVGLMYASFLIQLNRSKEAIVILNKLLSENYETVKVCLLLSLAYEQDQDQLLAIKYKSQAVIRKLRKLAVLAEAGNHEESKPVAIPPAKQPSQPILEQEGLPKVESSPGYKNVRLTPEQEDELYSSLASFLSSESINILAKRVLGFVKSQETPAYQQALCDSNLSQKNYEEALKNLEWILNNNQDSIGTVCGIGHCNFHLKRYQEAEQAYIKALRISSFSGAAIEDPLVLQRLGLIYVLNKQFDEAKVIFQQCQTGNSSSFTLLNFGITCIYLNKPDYQAALTYLSRANQLNPYNADIWGYIVFASLKLGYLIQAFQAQKEALKLKLANVDLLKSIGSLWNELGKYEEARDILELAVRMANPQSAKYQKKIEEFLKAVQPEGGQITPTLLRSKFREILVKPNVVQEDDPACNLYLDALECLYSIQQ